MEYAPPKQFSVDHRTRLSDRGQAQDMYRKDVEVFIWDLSMLLQQVAHEPLVLSLNCGDP